MTRPEPRSVRSALETILPRVRKPARYLGLERNLIRKPWDEAALHVALAFPDTYEIGMSHQGSRILYHLVNRRPDALAERTYAPWPDMGDALLRAGIPLYTLESYRPVADFDLLGITLQSELNYINVPYLLDLAGLARRAEDRREEDPIVLGGGPCTANPEPVADFFDAFLIGDAEAALDPILDTIRDARAGGTPRRELLHHLAGLEGVYVPHLYRWRAGDTGDGPFFEPLDPDVPLLVRRVWAERLDPSDQPETPIVPFAEVIQDRLGMEIMRGCTQGCRFCQAGFWYRPVREHDPDVIASRMERQAAETGFEQIGLLSLSTADYSQVAPLVHRLAETLGPRRVSVSLPSLRADGFSVRLAEAVSTVRKSGFTFAPETGSDRLRRVINKTFTNADMLQAAEAAFAAGWNLIKLYAMIGLPTETDEDLEELAHLANELVSMGRRIRGRKVEVKVSVGCFVPKPWTPFQWEPFCGVGELERRIALLRRLFRRIRGARLTWNDPREAALEALLSRGDRRLGAVISRARDLGALFDGWNEHLDLEAWGKALEEHGIQMETELGPRDVRGPLPWDTAVASPAMAKTSSWRPPRSPCCNTTVRRETPVELPRPVWSPPFPRLPGPSGSPRSSAATVSSTPNGATHDSSPTGTSWTPWSGPCAGRTSPSTSRRGTTPTSGSPWAPPCRWGPRGWRKASTWTAPQPFAGTMWRPSTGCCATPLLPGAPSLGKLADAARYRIAAVPGRSWPASPEDLPGEIREAVRRWEVAPDGSLRLELALRTPGGSAPSLKTLLLSLGIPEEEIPLVRVTRETVILRRRKPRKTEGGEA